MYPAQYAQVETGCSDDDIGLQLFTGFQADALFGKTVDLIGRHADLAGGYSLEQVPVRHKCHALLPGSIARREVFLHVVIGAQEGAHPRQQLVSYQFGLLYREVGKLRHFCQHLAAHDFMNPRLVDLQVAQGVRQVVGVVVGNEIGG